MRRARGIFAKWRSFAFNEVFGPKNFGSGGDQTAARFPFGIRCFVLSVVHAPTRFAYRANSISVFAPAAKAIALVFMFMDSPVDGLMTSLRMTVRWIIALRILPQTRHTFRRMWRETTPS